MMDFSNSPKKRISRISKHKITQLFLQVIFAFLDPDPNHCLPPILAGLIWRLRVKTTRTQKKFRQILNTTVTYELLNEHSQGSLSSQVNIFYWYRNA